MNTNLIDDKHNRQTENTKVYPTKNDENNTTTTTTTNIYIIFVLQQKQGDS